MAEAITRATTVREAVDLYPEAEAVFDKHGLAGCGGEGGPNEPIGFFAAVHQVDADALVRELNELASKHEAAAADVEPARRHGESAPYRWFLLTALALTLGGGITSGTAAAMTGGGWGDLQGEAWLALVQTHGHLQMFGFLGLFIAGMALHILPRFKGQAPPPARLAFATYGLLTAGLLMRVLTQPHAEGVLRPVFAASGFVQLAGAIAFGATVATILARAGERREPFDAYIGVATAGMVAAFGMNAYLTLDAARDGTQALNPAGDEALLLAMALGAVVPFVLGVAFRVLPFFLGLQAPRPLLRDGALGLLAVAVPLRVVAVWAPQFTSGGWAEPLERASTFAVVLALAGSAIALRVFEPAEARADAPHAYPGFGAGVRLAFGWLCFALALDAYWQLRELDGGFTPMYAAGAIRHAYILGFATVMMMAVSYRTIPVFSGREPRWPRAIPASFALVLSAAALRVLPPAFQAWPSDVDFKLMIAGGFLLFGGVGIWAVELATSMFAVGKAADGREAEHAHAEGEPASTPQRQAAGEGRIRPDTTVAEALEMSPLVLQVLLDYGFGPLADAEMRARMAPTITIERAAAFLSADPASLVETLNGAVASSDAARGGAGGAAPIEMKLIETGVSEDDVLEALRTCQDPEIPVNIVDLGLVIRVVVRDAYAHVTMTLTSPDCPMADTVAEDVQKALLGVTGISQADIDVVTQPAWSPAR
ncbi:MAG TPA: NnrS family protein, partial [Dehalococcoidia bacterium]|nr:NnrS family protein [Dehalococcoidia bacterium]